MATETIKQKSVAVEISTAMGERTVRVNRMAWKRATAFINQLVKAAAEFYSAAAPATAPAEPQAPPPSLWERLPLLIARSDELISLLVTGTTALNADEIGDLALADVLRLVDAGLSVNLDDETKNSFAGIVGRVQGFTNQNPR